MNKDFEETRRLRFWRLSIGAVLFFVSGLFIEGELFKTVSYAIAVIIMGYDCVISGISRFFKKEFFNSDLLITLAAVLLFISENQPEALGAVLFFQLNRHLLTNAVHKTDESFASVATMRPTHANVQRCDVFDKVSPNRVSLGETIVIKAGERVPLDAIVTEGEGFLDMRALTGNSIPVAVHGGSRIVSGAVNSGSTLYARVITEYKDSAVEELLKINEDFDKDESVTTSVAEKSKLALSTLNLLLYIVLLIVIAFTRKYNAVQIIERISVLFIVINNHLLKDAVTLAFKTAADFTVKRGIVIRNSTVTEKLATIKKLVFNTNGTLTDKSTNKLKPDSVAALTWLNSHNIEVSVISDNADTENELRRVYPDVKLITSEKYKQLSDTNRFDAYVYNDKDASELCNENTLNIAIGVDNTPDTVHGADISLISDEPSKLILAVSATRRAYRTAWFMLVLCDVVNIILALCAVVNVGSIWFAIFVNFFMGFVLVRAAKRVEKVKG